TTIRGTFPGSTKAEPSKGLVKQFGTRCCITTTVRKRALTCGERLSDGDGANSLYEDGYRGQRRAFEARDALTARLESTLTADQARERTDPASELNRGACRRPAI